MSAAEWADAEVTVEPADSAEMSEVMLCAMGMANLSLPNGHPQKLTHNLVHMLRNPDRYPFAASEAAAIIESLLPPERIVHSGTSSN